MQMYTGLDNQRSLDSHLYLLVTQGSSVVAGTGYWGGRLFHLLTVEVWKQAGGKKTTNRNEQSRELEWATLQNSNGLGAPALKNRRFIGKAYYYGNLILSEFLKLFLKSRHRPSMGECMLLCAREGELRNKMRKRGLLGDHSQYLSLHKVS